MARRGLYKNGSVARGRIGFEDLVESVEIGFSTGSLTKGNLKGPQ
jgi:hypothetical protein